MRRQKSDWDGSLNPAVYPAASGHTNLFDAHSRNMPENYVSLWPQAFPTGAHFLHREPAGRSFLPPVNSGTTTPESPPPDCPSVTRRLEGLWHPSRFQHFCALKIQENRPGAGWLPESLFLPQGTSFGQMPDPRCIEDNAGFQARTTRCRPPCCKGYRKV
ncbi:hypothetical protein BMS3Abin05_01427 [bacterium BMS3Abin05]|nr:hypothetical protein BMS3Abin05_01427 [bacterium BMS3Abin05]